MSNVPKLRFKEFTDEWESKKLGDVARIIGGGTPSTDIDSYWNGNILWFTPTEIKSQKYISISNRTITEEGLKRSSAKILPKGTVLLTTRAGLGDMAILLKEATTNQGFQSIVVGKNVNNEFIYYLKPQIKKYCYKNASGSTFLEVSKSSIENFKFKLPLLKEQEKIASFLSLIDKKINLQSEKVKALKDYKKGLMQKIFSRELRFKDENGNEFPEWEEKNFKDLVLLQRGSSPRPIQKYITTSDNGVNWIKIGDVSKNSTFIYKTKEKITLEGAKKSRFVNVGDLILSNSMSFGRPYIMGIDGCIHDGWFVLKNYSKNFNRDYLCHLLSSDEIQEQYNKLASGGVVENISSELVNSINMKLPSLIEQEKIANVLNSIDLKIEKEQEKLNLFNDYKKGLLQQMFV